MAGRNLIISRGIPIQKNDPAVLQTLSDKSVVRFVGGRITDYGGANIDPYEFTKEQFDLKTASDFAGITVRVTDIHQDSRGVGGILFTGGSAWTMQSPQIYYATYAAAIAAFPASSYPNLIIMCGDVGNGRVRLVSNGTRYIPINGRVNLYNKVYGSISAPTNNSGTGASYTFNIGTPVITAGLLAAGDSLIGKGRYRRHNANATMTISFYLGTAGNSTDAQIWATTPAATDNIDIAFDLFLTIGTATSVTTNSSSFQTGSGGALNSDKTANFNVASAMTLSTSVSKNNSDTLDLIAWEFDWIASN